MLPLVVSGAALRRALDVARVALERELAPGEGVERAPPAAGAAAGAQDALEPQRPREREAVAPEEERVHRLERRPLDLRGRRVMRRRFNVGVQKRRARFETVPRGDRSSKNQPERVDTDRERRRL